MGELLEKLQEEFRKAAEILRNIFLGFLEVLKREPKVQTEKVRKQRITTNYCHRHPNTKPQVNRMICRCRSNC